MSELASTTYVLGTDRDELDRLHRQHLVWDQVTKSIWERAGISTGTSVIDIGAGPGFASFDLSRIVGSTGKVYAFERSLNFNQYLTQQIRVQEITNIEAVSIDVQKDEFPDLKVDAAWCRWVCIFLNDPKALIQKISRALKPNGKIVFFEYYDYQTWKMIPDSPMVEEFVQRVVASWKETGSIANVAPLLISALQETGFQLNVVNPHFYAVAPGNPLFSWLTDYMKVNTARSLSQGIISQERSDKFLKLIQSWDANANSVMLTPTVMEIIASK